MCEIVPIVQAWKCFQFFGLGWSGFAIILQNYETTLEILGYGGGQQRK
jgi:hypothetical protein